MLELGPGDSLASGIIGYNHGALKTYLVDNSGDAIKGNVDYSKLFNYLNKNKKESISNKNNNIHANSIYDILNRYNIIYLTNGLNSLRTIPDSSIDYIWSQSVLEHIRKNEFIYFIRELRRIISINGVSIHGIDLKDHLSYSHNNLRFADYIWESEFMANSGFYTNRILCSEMTGIFKDNGFSVTVLEKTMWKILPTERYALANMFRGLSDDELLISEFDVILKPV